MSINFFFFKVSLKFLNILNNIFHVKDLKRFSTYVKLITIGERPNMKNIESLYLKQKVNFFLLL